MPLVRDRCIVVMTGMIYLAAERTSIGERLLLPLAETPDGPVTGVLGMAEREWVIGAVPREVRLSPIEYLPGADLTYRPLAAPPAPGKRAVGDRGSGSESLKGK